ncbi:MAG: hypothetical protein HY092_02910 [Candidatus Kerfeldbacteria bacterium]|nr:hypothetical protein [Candidatus Kerfeldbacteria bacterium]
MAREKSELKSGMGNSMRNYLKLVEAVEDLGGGDDQLKRIESDAALRVEIAKLIVGQSQNGTGNIHHVTVDRDKKLKAMIKAGRYDWTNSDINDKHFPVEGSGTVEIDIELVHYGRGMSTDAVLKDLDARGLRPAKIEELLALGAAKPELQREYPIIALGSVWQNLFGDCSCPYLYRGGSGRRLSLIRFGDGWRGICRFAAVRK